AALADGRPSPSSQPAEIFAFRHRHVISLPHPIPRKNSFKSRRVRAVVRLGGAERQARWGRRVPKAPTDEVRTKPPSRPLEGRETPVFARETCGERHISKGG
ncbi:hypothetical protein QU38_00280, partial [Staphylococcus aureus]